MGFNASKFYSYMDRKYAIKEGELALQQKNSSLAQQNNEANRQNSLALQGLQNQGSLATQDLSNEGNLERTKVTAGAGLVKQKMANDNALAVKNIGVKSAEKIAADDNTNAIDVQALRNKSLSDVTAANNAARAEELNKSTIAQARQAVLEGGIEGKLTEDSVRQGLMVRDQYPDYSALKQVPVAVKPTPGLYKQTEPTLGADGKQVPGELYNTFTGDTKTQEQGLAKQISAPTPADVRLYDNLFSMGEKDRTSYLKHIMDTDKAQFDRLKSMYNQEFGN